MEVYEEWVLHFMKNIGTGCVPGGTCTVFLDIPIFKVVKIGSDRPVQLVGPRTELVSGLSRS
jgi:hypothetical protein